MRREQLSLTMAILALAIASLAWTSEAQAWGWGGSCGSWGGYGGYHGGSWGGSGYGRGYYGGYRGYYGGGHYGRGYYGGGYYGRGYYGGGYYGRGYIRGSYGKYYIAAPLRSRRVTHVASARSVRSQSTGGRASLAVNVPADATVYVNGDRTDSTGQRRVYASQRLNGDEAARFKVRTVVDRNGRLAEETKVVTVKRGQTTELSFNMSAPESVQTALVLNVPEDASVEIEGRKIRKSGARRVLTTQRLAAGQQVDDLRVRVTLDRHGTTLSKEQRITLRGGQDHELTFSFDDSAVASR